MPTVKCANCGTDLVIDEPGGVAYVTYEDGTITCAKPKEDDVPQAEEQPSSEVV